MVRFEPSSDFLCKADLLADLDLKDSFRKAHRSYERANISLKSL